MKMTLCFLVAILAVAVLCGDGPAADERESKPRFKGVELYSWKDKEGVWTFALLDGTNREKTKEVVQGAPNPIKGVAALKAALAKLAEGEQVSWAHRVDGFEFPPEATRQDILKAAKEAKVSLSIVGDKE